MNENKIAHLGFIQGVINRMGSNSFLFKGWSVTLVAALFALSAKDSQREFVWIAYVPVIAFWLFDSYFLHQETLFRELYKQVANGTIPSDNFTMDTTPIKENTKSYKDIFVSKTQFWFHFSLVLLVLFVMVVRRA